MEDQKDVEEGTLAASGSPDTLSLRSTSKRYVEFDTQDPLNPRQWPLRKRYERERLAASSI